MDLLIWIILIVLSILIVGTIIWYIKCCDNQLDNIFKGKTSGQLLFLLGIVAVTIIYIFLLANLMVKDNQMGLLLKIYSLFSQTSGVDNAPDPAPFKLFSLFVSFIGSIIFSGLLISTFNNSFQRRISTVETGQVRYQSLRNHDVIIGGNEILFSVIQYLVNNPPKNNQSNRIVILSNHYPQKIKKQLGFLANQYRNRIIIYHGDINNKEELSLLRLNYTNRIVVLGDSLSHQCDSGNILITNNIIKIVEGNLIKKQTIKKLYLSYWDDSFMLKYFHDQNSKWFQVFPFNFYEIWGSKIWGYGHWNKKLNPQETFQYQPLSQGKLKPDSDDFVNLIILGFNIMGMELLKTAIKTCHYANFNEMTHTPKTQITIISEDVNAINLFKTRYPGYEQIPDISCRFIETSPFSPEIRTEIKDLVNQDNAISTIAICSESQDENYTLATHLPVEIYEKEIPIVVEYHIFSDYIKTMHEDERRYSSLRFFGFKNAMININYNLSLAQFIMKAEDLLYRRKDRGEECIYTQLPVLDYTKIEAEESWHKYKIDNRRQTKLTYVDSLFSILDSMNLQLTRAEALIEEDYKFEQLGSLFDQTRYRHMIAWNILAGYLPTDNIADKSNWKVGKVDILFLLSSLKKGTNRYNEVMEVCHFQQIALLNCLRKNGYKLEPKCLKN